MNVLEKFQATREELSQAMIERESEIDLALTALVAQEHLLLVGPPGTGKSMLSDALVSWMQGSKFSILLTKFSVPEEVFGPPSIQGLKDGVYKRIITGKLPEADIAFVDECFKASSAILNTLLQVLNERIFRNDGEIVQCPLKLCVAASNEWPGEGETGKELGALFDRFLFRKAVRPISSDKGRDALLWSKSLQPKLSTRITPKEIDQATKEASATPWTPEAKIAFGEIHREARHKGIIPGDRRMRKSVGATQAFAWLSGAKEVQPEHLEVVSHILWDEPIEQPKAMAEIVCQIAAPVTMKVNQFLAEASQIVGGVNPKGEEKTRDTVLALKKLKSISDSLDKYSDPRAKKALAHVRDLSHGLKESLTAGLV
jgi:MoxR-like ATPase